MVAAESISSARVEEYKAIVVDTAGVSSRRQNTNDLFAGINALFLTALGFFLVSSHFAFTDWYVTAAIVLVCLVTIFLNRTWHRTLVYYSVLLAARHKYIEWVEMKLREELHIDDVVVLPNTGGEPGKASTGRLFSLGRRRPPTDAESYPPPDAAGMFLYLRQVLFGPYPTFGFTRLEQGVVRIFLWLYVFIAVAVTVLTWLVTNHIVPPLL